MTLMTRRLGAVERELAAAWIVYTMMRHDGIGLDAAGRLLAESAGEAWDGLPEEDRDYYRTCAHNLLRRITDPPDGIPANGEPLWQVCT